MSCAIFYTPFFVKHLTPRGHPESPLRVQGIYEALKNAHLPIRFYDVEKANEDLLYLAHSKEYVDLVKREVEVVKKNHTLAFLTTGDVVISPDSFEAARYAVGAVTGAVDAVMKGEVKNAFAIVRPPGHHATRDTGMGFCLFNTVAIAARYVQKQYGIKRVLIIDWDVHHGNGTEAIVLGDKSILYFSTHQSGIYPGTGTRSVDNCINCPIAKGEGSREAIFAAFKTTLHVAIESFSPEFIFISCGFDAHKDDPLGELLLEDEDFYELTMIVKKYAKGKIVSLLEGGYNLEAIKRAAVCHVRGLTDESSKM